MRDWRRLATTAAGLAALLAAWTSALAKEKLRFAVGPFQPTPTDTRRLTMSVNAPVAARPRTLDGPLRSNQPLRNMTWHRHTLGRQA